MGEHAADTKHRRPTLPFVREQRRIQLKLGLRATGFLGRHRGTSAPLSPGGCSLASGGVPTPLPLPPTFARLHKLFCVLLVLGFPLVNNRAHFVCTSDPHPTPSSCAGCGFRPVYSSQQLREHAALACAVDYLPARWFCQPPPPPPPLKKPRHTWANNSEGKQACLVSPSVPQLKLPVSSLSARYFMFPPRQRTGWTRLLPSLVLAAGRPISNFLFFLYLLRLPPVSRRLCRESLEIPGSCKRTTTSGAAGESGRAASRVSETCAFAQNVQQREEGRTPVVGEARLVSASFGSGDELSAGSRNAMVSGTRTVVGDTTGGGGAQQARSRRQSDSLKEIRPSACIVA